MPAGKTFGTRKETVQGNRDIGTNAILLSIMIRPLEARKPGKDLPFMMSRTVGNSILHLTVILVFY